MTENTPRKMSCISPPIMSNNFIERILFPKDYHEYYVPINGKGTKTETKNNQIKEPKKWQKTKKQ